MLPDKFGRPVDILNISASGRCQYTCAHCKAGTTDSVPELLPTGELTRFVRILAALGLKRVRLIGGGEPLMRPDIVDLVAKLVAIRGLTSVSMSTNGKLLAEKAAGLKKAGLHRLFITIPSLDNELFKSITGYDGLGPVLEGLEAASRVNGILTTARMTLLPGVNEDEMEKIVDFSIERGIDLYIVEGHPEKIQKRIGSADIVARLASRYPLSRIDGASIFNNPWKVDGTNTSIKIVTTDTARVCGTCNRLWISADGVVTSCNMIITKVDLKALLEDDPSDEELAQYAAKIAMNKPMRGDDQCFQYLPAGRSQN
jgi:cyclic pyranopterin phosphate synthase